jgi:hypothetical protein
MNNLYRRQVIVGLQDSFTGVSRQITQNWGTLESGDRASCERLSSHVDELHRDLGANPEFRSKVLQTQNLATTDKSYHWIPLLEHDNCRSGLLYLPPGGRIAMHDHPDSIGVSIVLDGTPLISQCDRVSAGKNSLTRLVQNTSHARLQPHQKSFIFPHKQNMHGFSSSGSSCLLLNTLFHKQSMQQGFIAGNRFDRPLSRQHLPAILHRSLSGLMLSMSLILPASVTAEDSAFYADTAATVLTAIPFDTLERYALDGNVEAQASLARRYSSGDGVSKDLYRASIWYRRAAQGGCAEAQYQIGLMLLDGEGVTEDSSEGLEWIFRASQADHIKATSVFNYLMENPVALDC